MGNRGYSRPINNHLGHLNSFGGCRQFNMGRILNGGLHLLHSLLFVLRLSYRYTKILRMDFCDRKSDRRENCYGETLRMDEKKLTVPRVMRGIFYKHYFFSSLSSSRNLPISSFPPNGDCLLIYFFTRNSIPKNMRRISTIPYSACLNIFSFLR